MLRHPSPVETPGMTILRATCDQTAIGGAPTTLPGHGPNTRTLMKIVVTSGSGDTVPTTGDGKWLDLINAQLKNNFLTGNQPGCFSIMATRRYRLFRLTACRQPHAHPQRGLRRVRPPDPVGGNIRAKRIQQPGTAHVGAGVPRRCHGERQLPGPPKSGRS